MEFFIGIFGRILSALGIDWLKRGPTLKARDEAVKQVLSDGADHDLKQFLCGDDVLKELRKEANASPKYRADARELLRMAQHACSRAPDLCLFEDLIEAYKEQLGYHEGLAPLLSERRQVLTAEAEKALPPPRTHGRGGFGRLLMRCFGRGSIEAVKLLASRN